MTHNVPAMVSWATTTVHYES